MAYQTPYTHAVTVRLSAEEKHLLLVRSGIESRPIGQMARLLILQALSKSDDRAMQPPATSVEPR